MSGLLRHSILTRTIHKLLHPRLSFQAHFFALRSVPYTTLDSAYFRIWLSGSLSPYFQHLKIVPDPKKSTFKVHIACKVHNSSSMSYPGTFPYGSGHQQVLDR